MCMTFDFLSAACQDPFDLITFILMDMFLSIVLTDKDLLFRKTGICVFMAFDLIPAADTKVPLPA